MLEWITNKGKIPVDRGVLVNIIFRCEEIQWDTEAGEWNWDFDGDLNEYDIVKYSIALNDEPTAEGIGDVTSSAKGSGARYNSGKPDLSLIPICTLEDEAKVWAYGKQKYAAFNWMKGMAWSVPLACLQRHLAKWQMGEENDEESGLPHLAHAMCNLRMLTLYSKTYREGDDRPPKELFEGYYEKGVE